MWMLWIRRWAVAGLAASVCLGSVPLMAAAGNTSQPAAFDGDALDGYITGMMLRHAIPGLALAITNGEQIVYSRGYGDAGGGGAITPDTPFYIGSQSKSFTAMATMQLVEQGRLALDAPVQRYLPWFRVADDQATRTITVRQLLQHTSGLSEASYVEALPPDASLEDLARDLARARTVAAPGTRYSYFNPGYSVLGLLVERASGQSYGDYLAEHIFRPLRMDHTFTDPEAARAAGMAQGHSQVFAFPLPLEQTFYRYELPAGFIISSASDLARYAMALTGGGALDGQRVLDPASVQLLFTPNRALGSDYGFGWEIGRYYGETQITHGGDTERFHTDVVLLPESGLGLVLLINNNHLLKDYNEYNALTWSVVGLVTDHPLPPEPISSTAYGWGLLGVWLASLVLFGRRFARLGVWRDAARQWSPRRRWLDVGQHAGWIAVTALAVTVIGPGLLGRGFNWNWFVGFLPDVALVTMTLVAGEVGLLIAKLAALFVTRSDAVRPSDPGGLARRKPARLEATQP